MLLILKTFSQPVIATLADLGVKAEFTGRNDLEIDGKKFSQLVIASLL